jgi:hypothetical protein
VVHPKQALKAERRQAGNGASEKRSFIMYSSKNGVRRLANVPYAVAVLIVAGFALLLIPGSTAAQSRDQAPEREKKQVLRPGALRGATTQKPVAGQAQTALKPSAKTQLGFIPGLEVQLLSGEFTKWGQALTVNAPRTVRFRWSTKRTDAAYARWEVSDKPFPPPSQTPKPPVLAEGWAGAAPEKGKVTTFNINFSQFAPASPPAKAKKYYVRIRPVKKKPSGSAVSAGPAQVTTQKATPIFAGPASPSAIVTYTKPGPDTIFTTKGLQPELWRPMPIVINLATLEIVKADEEDDEEPYLMVVVVYADGTTIDAMKLGTSTVRIDSSKKTHENVPHKDGDLGSGDTVVIPDSTGRFSRSILPIGLNFLEFIEAIDEFKDKRPDPEVLLANTYVGILVIAMEEDATTTDAANAGRKALVNGIGNELNKIIQEVQLDLKKTPPVDFQQILNQLTSAQEKIMDDVVSAVKDETLVDGWWTPFLAPFVLAQAVDPDDNVGAAFRLVSYKQIRDAGPGSVQLTIDLKGNGPHYRVKGSVRKK